EHRAHQALRAREPSRVGIRRRRRTVDRFRLGSSEAVRERWVAVRQPPIRASPNSCQAPARPYPARPGPGSERFPRTDNLSWWGVAEERMSQNPEFIGIDVSKTRWDVALRPSGQSWSSPATAEALEELVQRLQRSDVALVVLEATGGL